jgi:D-alanyl-D-alanine carboxypeptidase (penicillin-binding protein 5/6)
MLLLSFGFQTATVFAQETADPLQLYARAAVLMDGDTGRVLYGKEADTELPMASTTKIMTCIVALEQGQADTVCTVSSLAASQPQVKLGMVEDDTFYLKDLLYSLMLESHNDTAVCVAETIGGSVEGFAQLMNEKAREIGCTQTYYITPNGLDAEDENGIHHTTARDLALVLRYCLTQSPKSEEFLQITRESSYSFTNQSGNRSYSCVNHNTFLNLMEGALSGKTGFTGNAGYCYVGALQRDGKLLIVSLLACGWPSHKGYKWVDTKKLMNYGLEHYEKREIFRQDLVTDDIAVEQGVQETVPTQAAQTGQMEVLLGEEEEVRVEIEMEEKLTAPVEKETQVGTVRYILNEDIIAEIPIKTTKGVGRIDYLYCLKKAAEALVL